MLLAVAGFPVFAVGALVVFLILVVWSARLVGPDRCVTCGRRGTLDPSGPYRCECGDVWSGPGQSA